MDDDIIIDDSDPRNARVRVVRHPGALRPGTFPGRVTVQRPGYPVAQYPAAQYPMAQYPTAGYPAPYQQPVIVQQPQRRFLDLATGEVLSLAAQAFAALQPLPAAPVALGRVEDDVSNLITYQSALATHAKRDEQLRTVGALIAKLLA